MVDVSKSLSNALVADSSEWTGLVCPSVCSYYGGADSVSLCGVSLNSVTVSGGAVIMSEDSAGGHVVPVCGGSVGVLCHCGDVLSDECCASGEGVVRTACDTSGVDGCLGDGTVGSDALCCVWSVRKIGISPGPCDVRVTGAMLSSAAGARTGCFDGMLTFGYHGVTMVSLSSAVSVDVSLCGIGDLVRLVLLVGAACALARRLSGTVVDVYEELVSRYWCSDVRMSVGLMLLISFDCYELLGVMSWALYSADAVSGCCACSDRVLGIMCIVTVVIRFIWSVLRSLVLTMVCVYLFDRVFGRSVDVVGLMCGWS